MHLCSSKIATFCTIDHQIDTVSKCDLKDTISYGNLTNLSTASLTFDPGFVGSDGGALDADVVLHDGLGGVDGHLIIGLVSVGQPKVIVQTVEVKVWEDQLQEKTQTSHSHGPYTSGHSKFKGIQDISWLFEKKKFKTALTIYVLFSAVN